MTIKALRKRCMERLRCTPQRKHDIVNVRKKKKTRIHALVLFELIQWPYQPCSTAITMARVHETPHNVSMIIAQTGTANTAVHCIIE